MRSVSNYFCGLKGRGGGGGGTRALNTAGNITVKVGTGKSIHGCSWLYWNAGAAGAAGRGAGVQGCSCVTPSPASWVRNPYRATLPCMPCTETSKSTNYIA